MAPFLLPARRPTAQPAVRPGRCCSNASSYASFMPDRSGLIGRTAIQASSRAEHRYKKTTAVTRGGFFTSGIACLQVQLVNNQI